MRCPSVRGSTNLERPKDVRARHGDEPSSIPEPSDPSVELRECTRRLNGRLGPSLASAVARSTGPEHARAWVTKSAVPGSSAARRLRAAYSAWCTVSEAEGEALARMWFTGANPWLDDDSPVNALRLGRLDAVRRAATAIEDGSFAG